ncbi:MAG TPA: isochorismatase family protein [Candidatus Hydrogenedentes bacterium]|nr:isochorismatase family protein [Candidatus Hydrogenedentota bacterium]HOK88502.1 isochorismatase family protein [Candidatus Hydrogenedentota bacterium]HPO30693.1 isochorismatase family protein [Candidatus Hydrogenedentota bacterium]
MLKRDAAALVVIDIQEVLLPRDPEVVDRYLSRCVLMIRAARMLGLPVLVTEQNPERLGGTHPRIAPEIEGIARIPKMEFGCFGNDRFAGELARTARRQLLLVGMESHVCVCQTALAGLESGYEIYPVRDAIVSSTAEGYKAGMERMILAGARPVTAHMAIFELLGRAGTPEFKALLPLLKE